MKRQRLLLRQKLLRKLHLLLPMRPMDQLLKRKLRLRPRSVDTQLFIAFEQLT